MKNRLWGTDLMVVVLAIVSVVFAGIIAVLQPKLILPCFIGVMIVFITIFVSAYNVRKIVRGVFFGSGKQSARQQLSFDNLALPLAIVNKNSIVWYNNSFRTDILLDNDCYLAPIDKVIPRLDVAAATSKKGMSIKIEDKEYTVYASAASDDDSLWVCYFVDDTTLKYEAREYHFTRPIVMQIVVDTYEEALKDLKESQRAQIMAALDQLVESYAQSAKGLTMKLGASRYHIIVEDRYYDDFANAKFEILAKARELKDDLTLSIGVGRGATDFADADSLARDALDMALGRGGDQAVVKSVEGYQFFGGTAQGVEKRNKVRSRVVANALRNVMVQSDVVLIMGHKNSDLDAIGAAVGVATIADSLGKSRHIIVREDATQAGALIDKVKREDVISDLFITPERAEHYAGPNALLVIVDTHTARMTESEEICNLCPRKVVIDHHRRMVDYIKDTVVSYNETYASSAAELVSEILQYTMTPQYKVSPIQAEAMLAGIMLDTRNFAEKTGVRTFEAAAYLRRLGANSNEILKFFAVPKEVYQAKSELVNSANIYKGVAISTRDELPKNLSLAIPQAANDLLTLDGVQASVVAVNVGNQINISARSMGEINVQLLMEYLGGGGHLTMAGAQLKDCTIEEATAKIIESIDNYKK